MRAIREALGATNALAGYGCVLDCEVEEEEEENARDSPSSPSATATSSLVAARVRSIGAGEADGAEEEPGLREVVREVVAEAARGCDRSAVAEGRRRRVG